MELDCQTDSSAEVFKSFNLSANIHCKCSYSQMKKSNLKFSCTFNLDTFSTYTVFMDLFDNIILHPLSLILPVTL